MKFFKFVLISAAISIFIFACANNNNQSSANLNVNATNSTTVADGNQPAANSSTAETKAAGDETASAQKIYSEKCVKCHKEDGTGGALTLDDGSKIKAPNFTTDRQKGKPDSDYIDTIENGAKEDGMPAFKGKISDDDIKNVVKYIRRNFQGKS